MKDSEIKYQFLSNWYNPTLVIITISILILIISSLIIIDLINLDFVAILFITPFIFVMFFIMKESFVGVKLSKNDIVILDLKGEKKYQLSDFKTIRVYKKLLKSYEIVFKNGDTYRFQYGNLRFVSSSQFSESESKEIAKEIEDEIFRMIERKEE
jgi:hypothetical protein